MPPGAIGRAGADTGALHAPVTRRTWLAGAAALAISLPIRRARAEKTVLFGLTPVFLDSDIHLIAELQQYFSERLGQRVLLVKRRTYQEITALLLSEQLDAAWICGFPLVQHPERLSLVAVPLWRGKPLYRSYIIVGANDPIESVSRLRGRSHAFSDPDSNSGYLVTRHLLTEMGEKPDTFFGRHFFTYGHNNVIRAVASGLAQSGSVDGYVWEVVRTIDPSRTEKTKVIRKSELLGFPPVACNAKLQDSETVRAISNVLVTMHQDRQGQQLLATLGLDGFVRGDMTLFAGIAAKYREVLAQT